MEDDHARWPGPAPAEVIAALGVSHGIAARRAVLLDSGQDSAARAFRVEADAGALFVKVRRPDLPRDGAAALALHLQRAGVPFVLAPIPGRDGGPSARTETFGLAVYPFVQGRTGMKGGLTLEQWRALGVFARRLHATPLPPGLPGRETYRPAEIDLAARVDAAVDREQPDAPAAAAARLWASQRGRILETVARTEVLGARLRERALPGVLCHADLHTNNVLAGDDGSVWVIDWDEAVLAPRERGLMFVVGGIATWLVSPDQTAVFLEGYGDDAVDPLALAYYRHAWAVQDVIGYAARIVLGRGQPAAERAEDAERFTSVLGPGEIVELAEEALALLQASSAKAGARASNRRR